MKENTDIIILIQGKVLIKKHYYLISIGLLCLLLFIVKGVAQTRRSKEDEFTKSSFVVEENQIFSYVVKACDPDGDIVSIEFEGLPEGAITTETYPLSNVVLEDPNSCEECFTEEVSWFARNIIWTPNYSQAGEYKIYVRAIDNKEGEDWVNYIIVVVNKNRPPIL